MNDYAYDLERKMVRVPTLLTVLIRLWLKVVAR